MQEEPSATTSYLRADRRARTPRPPEDPLLARLDQAILSLAALAARPQFHRDVRRRAGLADRFFPDHPARRVDPALYGVLAALVGDGMPGASSIAVRLGLHESTISHHLARLERRGLVERRRYFAQRCWSAVTLTTAGREAFETLRDARCEALGTLLEDWTEGDRLQLVRLVGRLADAVRTHNLDRYYQEVAARRAAAPERRGT